MREQIIEMLDFPRIYVRSNIDLENCTHAGNFAPGDPVCADCASRLECSWLYHSDDFSGLREKRTPHLISALEFALEYIEASSFRAGHRPRKGCRCEACVWLDKARKLHTELKRTAQRNRR